jgi:transposase, IS5 family
VRSFVGIDLSHEDAPDATTLLKFRRLLETNKLGEGSFAAVRELLSEQGLILREGTVDASLIAAPSSTKKQEKSRDPEMHQSKKGNPYYFGMKGHIGVDAATGVIQGLCRLVWKKRL